jgi:hypothetical protein
MPEPYTIVLTELAETHLGALTSYALRMIVRGEEYSAHESDRPEGGKGES